MNIIEVKNLKKHYQVYEKEVGLKGTIKSLFKRKYKTVKAVDNISFDIEAGELIGFIGPNGAGKTTTLKCLSGLLYPTSGDIKVLGHNPWDRKAEFQKQFALVMGQKNQLWWDLPAMETFMLNKEIYEVPNDKFKKTLDSLVSILDIGKILNVQVRKLSLGQRMKCELVASLLHQPKVLFLDEPTIGLDVVMQKTLRDFIKEYNREFNSTIILTSHYMDDVRQLCQRVIIIDQGSILFDGKLQSVIDKYARTKILTFTFAQNVEKNELEKFGTVKEYEFPKVKLIVKREDATKHAATILSDFAVADIVIEEPPIEAIIREVFTGKMRKA
jgi:ABC-2 type transport system ATP-binding protein